jgi:hypothetical protein
MAIFVVSQCPSADGQLPPLRKGFDGGSFAAALHGAARIFRIALTLFFAFC